MHTNKYVYYSSLPFKTRVMNQVRKLFRNVTGEKLILKRLIKYNNKTLWYKLVPPEYLYKKDSWRDYDRDGVKLKLDLSNLVDHAKYFNYQDFSIQGFVSLIREHDTVIDIGANIGITAIEFSRKAASGHVICYEPSLVNFKRLSENIAMNRLSNCQVNNIGLGSVPGTIKLYNPVESNSGMKRVARDIVESEDRYEDVEIDTLDSQVSKKGIKAVHAIKIDVEGFEMEVLKGARKTLTDFHPVLFVELVDKNLKEQGSSAEAVVRFLSGLGYTITNANNRENITVETKLEGCSFDILCK